MINAYLYGMIVGSNSFKLSEFVKPDEYTEIQARYSFPGGETGTCATVLSSLGVHVKMDGNHIGRKVAPLVKAFYKDKSVSLDSLFFDEGYEGLEDFVLIAGDARTPMGTFEKFYTQAYRDGIKRWNRPLEEDVMKCDAAAIDPYFQAECDLAAKYCIKHGKPYVTIDCQYDSLLHRNSAISIISGEGIHNNYPGRTRDEMFPLYQENGAGLTIITNGGKKFFYGRKDGEMKSFEPYKVEGVSTLGAGDTFKAGCTYALAKGMGDDELIRFASACSAVAISRYPSQLNPPTLKEVEELIQKFA